MTLLNQSQIDSTVAGLAPGWSGNAEQLARSIEFADFPTAVEFVVRLAPHCEEMNHHPDLEIHWRRVEVALSTHDEGGVSDKDAALATVVDEVAAGLPLAN